MLIEVPATPVSYPGAIPIDWDQLGYDYDKILSPIWHEPEAQAFAPPPDITVSEWADANRVLQAGISRNPGPWRTDYTPYLREIMDAYADPSVRHLVFSAGTQLGKTETLYNIAGYIIDHDPYPTLMMSPREDDAKLVSRTRIQPMIKDCECLRKKMPESRQLFQTLEMHFPGMILYLVGANSLAGLASKPCRNILRDEKDKYPDRLGADADPSSKSEERAKSYWDIRKVVDVSSPTFESKGILKDLAQCEVINVVHHPCPNCRQLIRLYPSQLAYDDQPGHKHRKQIAKRTAVYVCQRCDGVIKSDHRPYMIANYVFVQQENITFGIKNEKENKLLGEIDFEPEEIGFWVSSMSSPMLSWGDMVQKVVEAEIDHEETGDTTKKQNVVNDWFNEPWLEAVKRSSTEAILAKRSERAPLAVPEWAVSITAGIDVQKHGFWFSVWAFSKEMASAMIHYGFLTSWEDVYNLVFETTFEVEESENRMSIWRAAMDIGGGEDSQWGEDWTKTEEIIQWIRDNGQGVIHPVKGMSKNRTGQKIKHSILDKMPGEKGNIIPGGLVLWMIDTYLMKDVVFWRFENKEVDPQPLSIHAEVGEDFALQMVAEEKQRDKNGNWVYVQIKKDNHYLDTAVYAHAAADFQWLGGVKILSQPIYAAVVHKPQAVPPQGGGSSSGRSGVKNYKRPAWLNRR